MFLTPQECFTHLHEESIAAISGNDSRYLSTAISAAIGEITGSLQKYDTATLFAAEGEARNPLLLLWVKDVAVWHYINIANPAIDWQSRKLRYERVCDLLRYTQRGEYTPDFPLKKDAAGNEQNGSGFRIGSNDKRSNHI